MKIILSTRNPSKALQIQTFFANSPITILTLDDVGIKGDAVEDGTTLMRNATKKTHFAKRAMPGSWVVADDSGIFIDALNGEPGVRSARWAGENATTEEITNYCLARLKAVEDRSASFRTVVSVISPEGEEHIFEGEVRGHILEAPRVPPQPKMPYSPIFVPDGETQCWAEMTTEYENSISHRGIAFRKTRSFLEKYL